VDDIWGSQNGSGWMGVVLKNKLKGLKNSLMEWSRGEYGGMDNRIKLLMEDISELDVKGELGMLSLEEVEGRKLLFGELWKLLNSRDSSLVQRSRSKWLKEGDANSKFFRRCVKARYNRNSLKALKVDGEWLQASEAVRGAMVEYFRRHVASNS